MIEVIEDITIYDNPRPQVHSRHGIFPDLLELPGGELLALFVLGEAFESPNSHHGCLAVPGRGAKLDLAGAALRQVGGPGGVQRWHEGHPAAGRSSDRRRLPLLPPRSWSRGSAWRRREAFCLETTSSPSPRMRAGPGPSPGSFPGATRNCWKSRVPAFRPRTVICLPWPASSRCPTAPTPPANTASCSGAGMQGKPGTTEAASSNSPAGR